MTTPEGEALVARVDVVIAEAMMERAAANHRGDTNGPTLTDIAKRVLAALGLDDEFVARLADRRDSDEWVGNAVRARLLAASPASGGDTAIGGEPQRGAASDPPLCDEGPSPPGGP